MKWYDSVAVRLTGVTFLLLAATIGMLLFLVNNQMSSHFSDYVMHQQMMDGMMGMPMMQMMGAPEESFLTSVHESLLWAGLLMLLLSVTVSYFVARSISRPLRVLTGVAREIRDGKLGAKVGIERDDEVGRLAQAVDDMSGKLAVNETMRRQLFANIAHELRTPLAIIQGNLEGMMDDVVPMNKETILSMEEEVLRMNRLVADLRDLSLAEVNELTLQKKPCDINLILSRAVSMMQPLMDEKHIMVHLSLENGLPTISADPDRMNQVIYNLLNNAIRYIPDGRSISITTETEMKGENPWLHLVFSDTGDGIGPKDLPHIFQYFYRGEKSRNRKKGGSGIGLALVQQLILAHGGTIRAESSVGKGTSFIIDLPYKKE